MSCLIFEGCACNNECSYAGFQAIAWCYVNSNCEYAHEASAFAEEGAWTYCVGRISACNQVYLFFYHF